LPSTTNQKKRVATEHKGASAKKKIRKSRVPKDFVLGKEMDKERWLPMRDRSYYKPKRKKGKARTEGLTQGGVVVDERGDTPKQVQQSSGGGGGGSGQAKKKKAKKGGKW
jgi:signal recognition particle subunit SRP72